MVLLLSVVLLVQTESTIYFFPHYHYKQNNLIPFRDVLFQDRNKTKPNPGNMKHKNWKVIHERIRGPTPRLEKFS